MKNEPTVMEVEKKAFMIYRRWLVNDPHINARKAWAKLPHGAKEDWRNVARQALAELAHARTAAIKSCAEVCRKTQLVKPKGIAGRGYNGAVAHCINQILAKL